MDDHKDLSEIVFNAFLKSYYPFIQSIFVICDQISFVALIGKLKHKDGDWCLKFGTKGT
jgi:hypothetical protein